MAKLRYRRLQEETRIVKMVLSDFSMGISSALSTDLISTTLFRYIKAPEQLAGETDEEVAKKRRRLEEDQQAQGTYAGDGTKFVYRVKKPGVYGGYSIVTEVRTQSTGTRAHWMVAGNWADQNTGGATRYAEQEKG
jgi:hypothetical protein